MSYKILILEDNTLLLQTLEDFLNEHGYECTLVKSGKEALKQCFEHKFDLYLLDVKVPDMNGFEFLQSLRSSGDHTPAIFVTSLNDQESLTKGFMLGGDDYIKKPFELSELQLRIENIKRLRQIDNHGQIKIDSDTFFNYEKKVIIRNNEEFNLSKIESKILEYFLKNKNKTISIDEISVNNWLYDEMPESTTIRTYIKNLRKKLNDETITTLKGIGYRFNIS